MGFDGNADFCLTIEFKKESGDPTRVFKAMSGLIESFQVIDKVLVEQISSKIEPVLLLEDIESGSLKSWLRNRINDVDDEGLRNLDWKKIVGNYLVRAKYVVIDYLKDKVEFTDVIDVEVLESKLLESAKETNINQIPAYQKPNRQKLLGGLNEISRSMKQLDKEDVAFYEIKDKRPVKFNAEISFPPEKIELLLTNKTIKNKQEMILKVKKPDYLSDSMWEFKHDQRSINGKMLDNIWVRSFQERQVAVRPGDAIRAIVEIIVNYDHLGEVVSEKHNILRVLEVITSSESEQIEFKDEENKSL